MKITAAELARLLGLDEEELAAIESGRVRAGSKLLVEASDSLGVPVYWFFADDM